jgi:PAS domain S-box-containing protein
MEGNDVQREQLMVELRALRRRVAELEAQRKGTEEPQQVRDLSWLNDVALHLLALSDAGEILHYAGRALQEKLGDCLVLVLTWTPDCRSVRLKEFFGMEDALFSRVIDQLGFDPRRRSFPVLSNFEEIYGQRRLVRHRGSLTDFAEDVLPAPVARALARLLSIHELYTIGLTGERRISGNLHILTRRPDVILNPDLVETFAFQVALALERAAVTEELRRSEERLRMTVHLSPIGVGIVDSAGRLIDCNAALAEMVGYTRQELLALNFADFTHPDDLAREWALIEQLWAGERTEYRMEKRYVHKEGHIVWVDVAASLFRGETGELAFGFAFVQDVTARRQAAEALRRSAQLNELVLDSLPHPAMLVRDDRVILAANRAAREAGAQVGEYCWRSFGRCAYIPEAVRRHLETHPDDPPPEGTACAFCRAGEMRRTGQSANIPELEMFERIWDTWWVPVDAESYLHYTIDVTEHRRTEEALAEQARALEAVTREFEVFLENVPALIATFDGQGRYQLVNQAVAAVLQRPAEEVVGRTFEELLPPETAATFMARVERLVETGETLIVDDWVPVDGVERVYQTNLFPIGGTPDTFGSVAIDVTARVRAERSLRQHAERLRIEHEIDRAILSAQSSHEIVSAALTHLCDLIPYRRASVSEIDASRQRAREVIVMTCRREVIAFDTAWHPLSETGRLGDALQAGRVHLVEDTETLAEPSSLEGHLRAHGVRSYVSVPMVVRGELIGALSLSSGTSNCFRLAHIEILREVAASLSIALQQARLLEQARQAAETRALLLREVNHRVKNNLDAIIGLLYVERRHAPPEALPAYRAIMDDLTQRVTSLAQAHRMLSEAEWAPLRLSALVERVIRVAVRTGAPEVDVALDVAPAPVHVPPAQAHHLALVVSELTTNTLKYAGDGRDTVSIVVRVEEAAETITLSYRDDGPGYPRAVLDGERYNAGMEIVRRIVRKNLQGALTLDNDRGAVTEIRFERQTS